MDNAQIKALAEEIKGSMTTLTDAVNAEQAQVQTAMDELKAIIVSGGTEEERQSIYDTLMAAKTGIAAAIEDIKSTIPDEPVVEGSEGNV